MNEEELGVISADLLKEEHNSDENSFSLEGFIEELQNGQWDWDLLEDEDARLAGRLTMNRIESYQINLEAIHQNDKIMIKKIRSTRNKYAPERHKLPVTID